ncbi:hypothetical protein FI667_g7720, partial [Globisporangium splendens]
MDSLHTNFPLIDPKGRGGAERRQTPVFNSRSTQYFSMVSTDTVLHKGLLFKKGSGVGYPFGRRNWRTRHFVLTAGQLTYYTHEDGKWRGSLDLTTCTDVNDKTQDRAIEVMPADSPKTGRSASTIWRIAINTRKRRMLLAATSEREMNEWVEMLTLAIRINHKKMYVPRAVAHRMSLPDTASSGVSKSLAFVVDYHPMSNREPRTSIDGQCKILETEAVAEALARQQDEQFNNEVHQLLHAIHTKRTCRRSVPTELEVTFQSQSSMPKSKSISDFQNFAPHKNRSSFTAYPRSQGSRRSLDFLWDREDSWEETKDQDEEEKMNEGEQCVEDRSNCYVMEQPRVGSRERSNTFGRFRMWLTRQS